MADPTFGGTGGLHRLPTPLVPSGKIEQFKKKSGTEIERSEIPSDHDEAEGVSIDAE